MLNQIGHLLARRFLQQPVFVVGTSRSGTSVLLQAMGMHPRILAAPGEAPFITSMGGAAWLFEEGSARDYYRGAVKVPLDYLFANLQRLAYETATGPHYGLKHSVRNLLSIRNNQVLKTRWCAKTFPSANVAEGLGHLYPEVRYVYIVRNGFDVVQSRSRFHAFRESDFESQCAEWAKDVGKYQHLQELDATVSVRQEQLVSDPEAFFRRIFSFIELPYSPGPAYYVRNTLVHPLDEETQKTGNASDVLRARKPAFEEWNNTQRDIFKTVCGEAMFQAGYEIPY